MILFHRSEPFVFEHTASLDQFIQSALVTKVPVVSETVPTLNSKIMSAVTSVKSTDDCMRSSQFHYIFPFLSDETLPTKVEKAF